MPEIIETTTTGKTTTKWWSNYLTPQTMFWICAGFVWAVIFWKDSHDNWDKTKQLELNIERKADADDLKALKEQVTRQYSTAKEDREKESKQIEEALDWIEFEKGRQAGYKQAMEELKHK